MSLFPYSAEFIRSVHDTQDEAKISMYAGMLITAFALCEASTGMVWGRISDKIGRKPVLIMGLVGTAISMILFGFSKSLWSAIIARALGGLLNGNVGVLQTTVAELVTRKEHQPRAYSIMPFVWCLGSIIGPAMGGALAMPCEAYPQVFAKGGLFDKFPFLLPNLVCVFILVLGIVNGLLFIEETHPDLKHKRDRGRETGDLLWQKFCRRRSSTGFREKTSYSTSDADELVFDPPPGYKSTENSPQLSSTLSPKIMVADPESGTGKENRGINSTFTRQVVYIIIGYGILAYHSVSFDSLMPVMLNEERSSIAAVLPFKLVGGFGMSPKNIGFMMAVQGIYSMVAQLCFFPFIVKRLGTLNAFRLTLSIWPLLYFLVPYLVLLPPQYQSIGIYAALLTKITFHVVAFPSNAVLLANAAPSRAVLGTINGMAASTACLCRAFGPTVTGFIHSAGLSAGYNAPAWWAGGVVCAIGALEAYCIKDTDTSQDRHTQADDEQAVCEPLLTTTVEEAGMRNDHLSSIDELDLNLDVKS